MDIGVSLLLGGLAAGFALGASFKTLVWWKSLAWATTHGHSYANEVQQLPPSALTRTRRLELIKSHHGDFRPCGAKSVRLQLGDQRWFSRPLDWMYVKTPLFVLQGAVFALAACLARDVSAIASAVAVVVAGWVCLYSLMLIVEAIAWYVIAKDYTRVWGDIKFAAAVSDPSGSTLGDFKALGAVTLTAVLASSVLISVIAQTYGGFHMLAPSRPSSLGIPTFISSIYYVLASMTTVGDPQIAPVSTLARAGAALLELSVLLTIGFVISAIAARLQERR